MACSDTLRDNRRVGRFGCAAIAFASSIRSTKGGCLAHPCPASRAGVRGGGASSRHHPPPHPVRTCIASSQQHHFLRASNTAPDRQACSTPCSSGTAAPRACPARRSGCTPYNGRCLSPRRRARGGRCSGAAPSRSLVPPPPRAASVRTPGVRLHAACTLASACLAGLALWRDGTQRAICGPRLPRTRRRLLPCHAPLAAPALLASRPAPLAHMAPDVHVYPCCPGRACGMRAGPPPSDPAPAAAAASVARSRRASSRCPATRRPRRRRRRLWRSGRRGRR